MPFMISNGRRSCHDVLFSKLESWEAADRRHAEQILQHFPLDAKQAKSYDAKMPYRQALIQPQDRITRYAFHFDQFLRSFSSADEA